MLGVLLPGNEQAETYAENTETRKAERKSKETNQEQSNKAEVNGSAETERGRQVKRRGNVSTAVYSRVMISPVSLTRAHFYSMCVQLIQA